MSSFCVYTISLKVIEKQNLLEPKAQFGIAFLRLASVFPCYYSEEIVCWLIFIFINKLKVWQSLFLFKCLSKGKSAVWGKFISGTINRPCHEGPKTTPRFSGSLEGLIGLSTSSSRRYNLLQSKDTKQTQQREKMHWVKSGGKKVKASKSHLPGESHRTLWTPPASICDNMCEMLLTGEDH